VASHVRQAIQSFLSGVSEVRCDST
jgi:hypothetical protein